MMAESKTKPAAGPVKKPVTPATSKPAADRRAGLTLNTVASMGVALKALRGILSGDALSAEEQTEARALIGRLEARL